MTRRRALPLALLTTLVSGLLASGVAPAIAAAGPATHVWPSSGCLTTLQDCIDAANEGDTVQVATDTPVDERLDWSNTGITLAPAPGFSPTVKKGLVFEATGGSHHMRLERIRFEGSVDIHLSGGSDHAVELERVVIRATTSGPNSAAFSLSATVPAAIEIARSSLSSIASQAYGARVYATNASGLVTFRMVGTRISGRGNADSGGGLHVSAAGPGGSVHVDLYNTVIHDVARCDCGAAAGLGVFAGSTAKVRVRAAGLTIDRARSYAFGLEEQLGSGGELAAYVFGSIFSRTSGPGITIAAQHPADVVFRAGYNDFYANSQANQLAGKSLGSHNLFVSPRYVDASTGNLRLRSTSPLIDRGIVCSPGGVANPDADGKHRLAGKSVDMGAYERNGSASPGMVFVGDGGVNFGTGSSGRDIFCGYGGGDAYAGRGGADFMDGGTGGDFLGGQGGADRMYGRSGNDTLCAVDGLANDVVDGGSGTDSYDADPGDTRVSLETLFRPCHD